MLDEITPREQKGRDTLLRYRMQIRAAAIASLAILENKEIDRVYCDLHDDFIVRKNTTNGIKYQFYQVKTNGKQNHNWSCFDIFGIPEKKTKPKLELDEHGIIKNSFIGKQLINAIKFSDACEKTIFQTNINNSEKCENIIADIKKHRFQLDATKKLIKDFNSIFSKEIPNTLQEEAIKDILCKIDFETDVQYLKNNSINFESYTTHIIYTYSEVELSVKETKEILLKLLALVDLKSSGVILEFTKESIENLSGISINELLSVLSLSSEAYQILVDGGDPNALKTTSIIQRTLSSNGATEEVIEFCSQCKIAWDKWVLDNRHIIMDFSFLLVKEKISHIVNSSKDFDGKITMSRIRPKLIEAVEALGLEGINIGEDLILGGVFSEIVRSKS